jgi:hypothetical protein
VKTEAYEKKACSCGTYDNDISSCCPEKTGRNEAITMKTAKIPAAGRGCSCGNAHTAEGVSCCGESADRPATDSDVIGTGCSCRDAGKEKKVAVEYLYLDLHSCDRCIGTDRVLDDVISKLAPVLEMAGYTVNYTKVEMENEEMAIFHRFVSSPTIRVNGRDIALSVQESPCGCCSDISGTNVDCRVFEYDGKSYEIPPKEMLTEAIMAAVLTDRACCGEVSAYQLPENLKQFYDGKSKKCAGGNCC